MANVYEVGSVSSLINAKSNSDSKLSKEQKKLNKLFDSGKVKRKNLSVEIDDTKCNAKKLRDSGTTSENVANQSSRSNDKIIEQLFCDTSEVLIGRLNPNQTQTRKRRRSEDEEDDTERKTIPRKTDDKFIKAKTIFVGNLPLSITKKKLHKMFSPFGTIENTRFRGAIPADLKRGKKFAVLKKKFHPKCKSINAYICFTERKAVPKAKSLNGTELEGFHIQVNEANFKKKNIDHKKSTFVGNLPFDIHEQDLREHFLDCGPISNVRVIRDKMTGVGKGFGYVTFEDTDAAMFALQLNDSELNGRKIRVKASTMNKDRQIINDDDNKRKKLKGKESDKDFVGMKAVKKKKKKNKPKHMARKLRQMNMQNAEEKEPQKVVKSTDGPNKHVVFV
ncbi:RNA-binding protein 34 [Octopus bimaculoides]|uniref:RRM domain-containing protein n=1 Tax=Octopus bimaculoides TaxID=37653 RepID=A0A0L8I9X7_OCTBM|nr:RNA-binding protein 34 [Octopus bimaculoides]|eukprot:XP_014782643.1 PREDICTED: RNA-binding protein 34-like [Octopus bimaculoides]